MLRQMEWSTIHVIAKRGKHTRQIATALEQSPTTIGRMLREQFDRPLSSHRRVSKAGTDRPRIETEFNVGRSAVRILERAREDWEQSGIGTHTTFEDRARSIRRGHAKQPADAGIPIHFERLPAEYIQIDRGEIRRFPFTQEPVPARHALSRRPKSRRWRWERVTSSMRRGTRFRGPVDCVQLEADVPGSAPRKATVLAGEQPGSSVSSKRGRYGAATRLFWRALSLHSSSCMRRVSTIGWCYANSLRPGALGG